MKKLALIVFGLTLYVVAFPQFISGDCCTCSAYQYGSAEGYFRDSTVSLSLLRDEKNWTESSFIRYNYRDNRLSETIGYRFDQKLSVRTESYIQMQNADNDRKKIERLYFRWDAEREDWSENQKNINFFNGDGQYTHNLSLKYNETTGDWENNIRHEKINDHKTASFVNLTKKWDKGSKKWTVSTKSVCTDDLETLTRICVSFKLVQETANWEQISKSVYIYNPNMYVKETTVYVWDKETGEWTKPRYSEYKYDLTGRKTHWYSWAVDEKTGEKTGKSHQQYIYDKHGNNTEVHRYSSDRETAKWNLYHKQINYWSVRKKTSSGINKPPVGSLTIYPNPFTERAMVNLTGINNIKKIELTDINSRLLRTYKQKVDPEIIIEKRELKPGIYFIKVYADRLFIGRMVIR